MNVPVMLRVLLVDDEPLARARLRTLLGDCREPQALQLHEAANATQALELLGKHRVDLVLLDIHMPGSDGLSLAARLRVLPAPPAVVFVTAHAEHALRAFELDAVDYLTKPVRKDRLQAALQKVERTILSAKGSEPFFEPIFLLIPERGRLARVPMDEVIYLKAELKYLTVRTATDTYLLEGSLSEFEAAHAAHFLRIHRNALIARRAVRSLERVDDPQEGAGWAVRLQGVPEALWVSRRQLAAVRALMGS
jgi:two-component system, LytTR family, response regulator AlgR